MRGVETDKSATPDARQLCLSLFISRSKYHLHLFSSSCYLDDDVIQLDAREVDVDSKWDRSKRGEEDAARRNTRLDTNKESKKKKVHNIIDDFN